VSTSPHPVTPLQVFRAFLRLGLTSFGGPIAHLGYFQREFVQKRQWITQQSYADLIALAQSLPGPASSQVGFAIGLQTAGLPGALAAFLGFTTPSALLMLSFALLADPSTLAHPIVATLLHGLSLVAVAVVAQAVWTMRQSLAPDPLRSLIAVLSTLLTLAFPAPWTTLLLLALAAVAGLALFRNQPQPVQSTPLSQNTLKTGREDQNCRSSQLHPGTKIAAACAAALFFLLLSIPTGPSPTALSLFSAFYRTGALVIGGGHVVLPLLESTVVTPGWLPQSSFLAGYGAAQALPGPLFSLSGYLGACIGLTHHISPIFAGLVALLALFAPGLLAILAIHPFWNLLRGNPRLRSALTGINAAVVGLLLAALLHPLATSTLHHPADFAIALAAFAALHFAKLPPWQAVLLTLLATLALSPRP
jgi:chromate transporter